MKNPFIVALVLQAAAPAALGQQAQQTPDAPQAPTAPTAVRPFPPAYFARYNPVTALDMVRQLPGFVLDTGATLRGFGATAGNVLIDGQRPSSKTSIADELARIAARDVARIELIGAAAAGDIDVKGYTELANIVLRPATQPQTSGTFGAGLQYQEDARISGRIGGTRSWKTHDWGLRINGQITQSAVRAETEIRVATASGALTQTRSEFVQPNLSELATNASLNWTPTARDAVNVTGRVMIRGFTQQTGSIARNAAGAATLFVTDDYTDKDVVYLDLGGDWEHRFSPASSFKFVSVNSLVNWRPQEYFQQFLPSGQRQAATRNNADGRRGEHVLRGVWTIKPDAQHTVELGLEGAYNYRDFSRSVSTAIGAGPFAPQFLPVASTRVEEVRGEVFINDTWRIDPKLTLELGFTYEASKISQTGDANQEREFTYPKPRVVATWLPSDKDQLRLAVERSVAQLDFGEFTSVVQLVQNQLTVGNPNLQPAQTWNSSLQWKRPLGQRGSISLTGFYDRIDEVQDFVVIQTGPTTLFTGAGNIGDGERWGGRAEATLPLDAAGVKGGLLKLNAGVRDSKVIDPISGMERRIANEQSYDAAIDFRQDLPDLKLAWGADYNWSGDSEAFRLSEEQKRSLSHGDLDLFVETTRIKGLTVRLTLENLGDAPSRLERRFFSPSRIPPGAFSSTEFRETTQGPQATITVQGTY